MPKVKATKTCKMQFVFQDFSEKFVKSSNNEFVQLYGFLQQTHSC